MQDHTTLRRDDLHPGFGGLGFVPGEPVMHPFHGVGWVEGFAEEIVGDQHLTLINVRFDEKRLRLKVPEAKASKAGLRRVSAPEVMEQAIAVLRGRSKRARGAWLRRVPEYQAKINSGDPRLVAEVLRDLGYGPDNPDRSFTENKIVETALDRLSGELAAVDGTDRRVAVARILEAMAPMTAGAESSGGEPVFAPAQEELQTVEAAQTVSFAAAPAGADVRAW